MRRIAPLIALLLLLGSAPAARAGQITIDFDLSGSSISILGGAIVVPPDGSITSAGTKLQVEGSSNANASAGPARLESLTLAGTISPTTLLGGAVTVSGGVNASQTGSAAGVLNPALTLAAFGGTGVLSINALINCTPPRELLQLPRPSDQRQRPADVLALRLVPGREHQQRRKRDARWAAEPHAERPHGGVQPGRDRDIADLRSRAEHLQPAGSRSDRGSRLPLAARPPQRPVAPEPPDRLPRSGALRPMRSVRIGAKDSPR